MSASITKVFSEIPSSYICLGYISGVFGVRGEVKVFLHNPETDLFDLFQNFILMDGSEKRTPVELRIRSGAGKKIIGKIAGVDNRNSAEALVGKTILFPKESLPALPAGEWYHHQLLGLVVKTKSGENQGRIVEIIPGEVDIWVCENEDFRIFIPHTDDDVLSVNLESGIVIPDADSPE